MALCPAPSSEEHVTGCSVQCPSAGQCEAVHSDFSCLGQLNQHSRMMSTPHHSCNHALQALQQLKSRMSQGNKGDLPDEATLQWFLRDRSVLVQASGEYACHPLRRLRIAAPAQNCGWQRGPLSS